MGMFDHVIFKTQCPCCGTEIDYFQSKDGDCIMANLKPIQVNHFYGACSKCHAWIDFEKKDIECIYERTIRNSITEEIINKYTKLFDLSDKNVENIINQSQEQVIENAKN